MHVLVAYGRDIIREGLVTCLKKISHVRLVSICDNQESLLNQAYQLKPDIILLDGNVAGEFPETIKQLRKELPETRIILVAPLLRQYHDPLFYLNIKTDGYIDLDIEAKTLSEALDNVINNESTISPIIAEALLKKTISTHDKSERKQQPSLTTREVEIITLVAKGKNNREIAKTLFVSENTIKVHLQSILRKMNVHTRMRAAILAKEKGMIENQHI